MNHTGQEIESPPVVRGRGVAPAAALADHLRLDPDRPLSSARSVMLDS